MSDDLDLRGIDRRHEPDPQFRAALQRRLAAIVEGTDPGSVTEARELATIDLEPTHAKIAPSRSRRRVAQVILIAAAAVAATALVESRNDDATPADQPSPTVTVPPTTPSQPLRITSGELVPGTYFVDEVAGTPTPRIFATLGAGWTAHSSEKAWHIAKRDDNRTFEEMARDANKTLDEMPFDAYLQHDVGVMEFSRPVAVYSDACHPGDGTYPGPVDTVDGLVGALSEQRGWAEVTAPSDISVDGYVGKAFQRAAPTDMSDCDTRNIGPRNPDDAPGFPDFRSWKNPDEPAGWAGFYYEPGWIETLWVLDLDGTMVVISTGVWPEPSAGADADFAADVLDSIRIDRASPNVTVPPTVPRAAWSPELSAQTLEIPITSNLAGLPLLAVSPDGTLVALDQKTATLTWYEEEPRVVPVTLDPPHSIDDYSGLMAIGPHDIAYISVGPRPSYFVAVAPSGAEITRVDTPNGAPPLYPAATGLVATGSEVPNDEIVGAVGRPRREPDHRQHALPHREGHRCRARGPSRGTGMAGRRRTRGPTVRGCRTSSPDPTAES